MRNKDKLSMLGWGSWLLIAADGSGVGSIDQHWHDKDTPIEILLEDVAGHCAGPFVKAEYEEYQKVGRSIKLVKIKSVDIQVLPAEHCPKGKIGYLLPV